MKTFEEKLEVEIKEFVKKYESPFLKDAFSLGLGFQDGARWAEAELQAEIEEDHRNRNALFVRHAKEYQEEIAELKEKLKQYESKKND